MKDEGGRMKSGPFRLHPFAVILFISCSRYPTELYAQNGIIRPSGSRNSTQHFITFFTLNVHGSMKSRVFTMKMWRARSRGACPLRGRWEWQEGQRA